MRQPPQRISGAEAMLIAVSKVVADSATGAAVGMLGASSAVDSAAASGASLSLAASGGTLMPTPELSPSSTTRRWEGTSGATVGDVVRGAFSVKMQPLSLRANKGGPYNLASIACFSCRSNSGLLAVRLIAMPRDWTTPRSAVLLMVSSKATASWSPAWMRTATSFC